MKKRVIITGVGRSATGYTARLLTQAGLLCGHEEIYTGHVLPKAWNGHRAEASWFAGAHLDFLSSDISIYLQVRDPLKWLRSWIRVMRTQKPGSPWGHTAKFIIRHFGEQWWTQFWEDRLIPSMELWLAWNLRIRPHVKGWWRVEDLRHGCVSRMLEDGGAPVDDGLIAKALRKVPFDINTKKNDSPEIQVQDLPKSKSTEAFLALAQEFGYSY